MTGKSLPLLALRAALRATAPLIPDGALAKRWLALPGFIGFHGHLPRPLDDPRARYRDFLYARMTGPWTAQYRACVDKLEAKRFVAQRCPRLRIAKLVAVLDVHCGTRLADVEAFLQPYRGQHLVAKPTHTSGISLFLDRLAEGDIARLYAHARRDYYLQAGEVQYRGLPKRILIEESLADDDGTPPPDWRFACTRGIPWFGMADFTIDGRLHEHYFSVPELMLIDANRRGAAKAAPDLQAPPQLTEMLEIAAQLAAPFDFVRVDLYLARGAIWFGEYTFTPLAARERFSDPALSRWLCQRALNPEARTPLPAHLHAVRVRTSVPQRRSQAS